MSITNPMTTTETVADVLAEMLRKRMPIVTEFADRIESALASAEPVAWFKSVFTPAGPHSPEEYDIALDWGRNPPDGAGGWSPLYAHPAAKVEALVRDADEDIDDDQSCAAGGPEWQLGFNEGMRIGAQEERGKSTSTPTSVPDIAGTLCVYRHIGGDDGDCEYHFSGKVPPGKYDIVKRVKQVSAPTPASVPDELTADDVQWIVNDNAELGVMIRGNAFFLYKGDSLVYSDAKHDDGTPMHYRTVCKREFGECAHPINHSDYSKIGTVSLGDSDRWQLLPPTNQGATP